MPGRRESRNMLQRLTCVSTVGLIILWVLETWGAERTWITTLITYIPQHLFGFPALVLLAAAIVRRNRGLIAVNAVAVVFFAITLLGFNIPLGATGSAGPTVRVMTYNIHHGLGGVDRIARNIRSVDPDIVCLQETNAIGKKPAPLFGLMREFPRWHSAAFGDVAV